jgi:circadian clock protein KaiC
MDLKHFADAGTLFIEQVDAAQVTPGEFAHRARDLVDSHGISAVLIDSINGYRAAMPEENSLILHVHELLQYLNRRGASTFLTVAQHGIVGSMDAPVDITYLADTVILLRYFEANGQVRRAVSVVKKRAGSHESTIREFTIGSGGISLGEPLSQFTGVLLGVPTFTGSTLPPTQGS